VDWCLAFLPILAVLVLMLRWHWGGAKAGAVGWVLSLCVAALRFGAGWDVLAYAQLKGLLLTLYVLYIIWTALLFYRVADEAGAVAAIGAGLPRLTADRGMQALLLGWVFSSFLQGMGGFGVPVAVVAPLLVGLGFPPTAAIVIPSVGHPWAVTFGSLGLSFHALMATTGRPGAALAPWAAVVLGVACLGCGAATLWAAGGRRTLRAAIAPLAVIWVTMAGVQYLVVTNGLWSVGATLGGLAGLVIGIAWARWQGRRREPPSDSADSASGMRMAWAALPYLLLVTIVLVALIPPVRRFLGGVVIRASFPELATARGWVTPAGEGRTINVFGHTGALLLYASLLTYLIYKWRRFYRRGAERRIGRGVARRALRTSLGTAAMVLMAVTMVHAGMTNQLADGLARIAGRAFPVVSPFIGALGAFMTGSNTNSNVVFAALQDQVAVVLGISPFIILAAQTAGGAIGSAFAPAKIIVGCSTVESAGGESEVLRAVMRYGLTIISGIALLAVVLIYVVGG
jgi:lactate permease